MNDPWSHNNYYHPVILRAIPPRCVRALDAGCGQGLLARRLAPLSEQVVGIDADRGVLPHAHGNVRFVAGDVMTYPFSEGSFEFIAAVASLHHLPLHEALARFRSLLKPGGVLAVIGLYRAETLEDRVCDALALPASWAMKLVRGRANVGARIQAPAETLREIRAAADQVLPGSACQRRLFFRYSLIWRKPD